MSSSESPNKPGSYTVGLSTARFLDQAMLDDVAPVVPASPASPVPAPAPRLGQPLQVASPPTQSRSRARTPTRTSTHICSNRCSGPTNWHQGRRSPPPRLHNLALTPRVLATPSPKVICQPLQNKSLRILGQPNNTRPRKPHRSEKPTSERFGDSPTLRRAALLNSFQQNAHRKQSRVSGIVAICSLVVARSALFDERPVG
jgi:hypothetical protein